MEDARFEMNLMLSEWANRGVNLWKVDLQSIPLVTGKSTYYAATNDIAADSNRTIMVLDAFIRVGTGSAQYDRVIMPISRTEWAQTPNKKTEAPPTTFWFDRLIQPTITVWPVPDQDNYYTLYFYRVTQVEDSNLVNGQTIDVPYRWLNAAVTGLAARLSQIYAPERAAKLEANAEQSYQIAATQDTENVPVYIIPGLSGYFRM
jgi:hypothetical protein